MELSKVIVIKKDGTRENFNPDKIITAVQKSASRVLIELTDEEKSKIRNHVIQNVLALSLIHISFID